jgi:hypothetical protein
MELESARDLFIHRDLTVVDHRVRHIHRIHPNGVSIFPEGRQRLACVRMDLKRFASEHGLGREELVDTSDSRQRAQRRDD